MSLTLKVLAKTEETEIVFTGKILCWSNHPTIHWYQCHILYITIMTPIGIITSTFLFSFITFLNKVYSD